jgi:tetratricopeptide (TPR) repeat protein
MAAIRAFLFSSYGALTLLVVLVFAQVLTFDFVGLDDGLLVYNNPIVTKGQVGAAFTTYDPELYIPLTFISYQIEHMLFGSSPMVFHFSNLLLHLANVLLAFWCCTLLLRNRFAALIAAALFAVHPLQVEAVAWIAARKDLLSAFFVLAGMGLYLRGGGRGGEPLWWGSVGAFFLGLLSKVTAITLFPILLLVDWLQGRISRNRVLEKWPFLLLSIIFGIVAVLGKQSNFQGIALFDHVLLIIKASGIALWHIAVPTNLTVLYQQHDPLMLVDMWPWVLCCAVYSIALVIALRHSRAAAFGLLFFLATFTPSYATFQKSGLLFFASDRYTYIGLLGIGIALGTAIAAIAVRAKRFAVGMAVVLIASAGAFSLLQLRHWQSSETLYSLVLQDDDRSLMAHNNLGAYFQSAGDMQRAEEHFRAALTLDPSAPAPLTNLGLLLQEQGNRSEALELFVQAADGLESSDQPVGSAELAPYFLAADILSTRGDLPRAISMLRRAVARNPAAVDAHVNLAILLHKSQRYDDARIAFEDAIVLQPDHIDALYRLASVYGELGMLTEAQSALEKVVRMNPGYEKAQLHLLNIRSATRQ